jgi:hypothetical protein
MHGPGMLLTGIVRIDAYKQENAGCPSIRVAKNMHSKEMKAMREWPLPIDNPESLSAANGLARQNENTGLASPPLLASSIHPMKSAGPGMWSEVGFSTVDNRPMHSLKPPAGLCLRSDQGPATSF